MWFVLLIFSLFQYSYGLLLLDCNYSMIVWNIIGPLYTCTATVNQYDDGRQVSGVSQNHMAGRNDSDVQAVWLYGQTLLNFIPEDIDRFFENLQGFAIERTSLKYVAKEDLHQFPKLETLQIRWNQLETLDGDLFIYNPSLRWFIFESNKLTNIGPNILSNLPNLTNAYFQSNLCINSYATSTSGIEDLKRSLAHQCPPSAEMLERFILSGETFETRVKEKISENNEQIEATFASLNEQILNITESFQLSLRRLEIRIDVLEAMNNGTRNIS